MRKQLVRLSALALAAMVGATQCGRSGQTVQIGGERPTLEWQYPVRLGDSRSRLHEVLGSPDPLTTWRDWFPASGVEVWFDPEGRVGRFAFSGEATVIAEASPYATPHIGPIIPSDKPVLAGIGAHTDEAAFRRVLGAPAQDETFGTSNSIFGPETHCIWKTGGFVIDAEFLGEPKMVNGKSFSKGTLISFDVRPGI